MTARLTARSRFVHAVSPTTPQTSLPISAVAQDTDVIIHAATQARFVESLQRTATPVVNLPHQVHINRLDFTDFMDDYGHPLRGSEKRTSQYVQAVLHEAVMRANRWIHAHVADPVRVASPTVMALLHTRLNYRVRFTPAGRGSINGIAKLVVERNTKPLCLIELMCYGTMASFEKSERQALLAAATLAEQHDLVSICVVVSDFKRWRFLRVNQDDYDVFPITNISHDVDNDGPPDNDDVERHVQLLMSFFTSL